MNNLNSKSNAHSNPSKINREPKANSSSNGIVQPAASIPHKDACRRIKNNTQNKGKTMKSLMLQIYQVNLMICLVN